MPTTKKKLIVLSSPSGGGKSTVARFLLRTFPQLQFSISATTRPKRPREQQGREYYFMDIPEFFRKLQNNEMIESEEIFGQYYGTLKSEIDKAINQGKILVFDVDVKGALSLKLTYPRESVLIFLKPANMEALEQRLRKRHTESEEQIQVRLKRVEMEIGKSTEFDHIIINDVLADTFEEVKSIVEKYIL
ncbi:MAG: guanylate kinase [Ignavibacteriae bacterium]|nr:guanylate kinase [Ignavibacteriota bacterium]